MTVTEILLIVACVLAVACLVLLSALFVRSSRPSGADREIRRLRDDIAGELRSSREETLTTTSSNIRAMGEMLKISQDTTHKAVSDRLYSVDKRFQDFSIQSEQRLDNMRATIEHRLAAIQQDNGKRLEEMRATVDEKLQKSLEEKIGQSFKLVSERLEQVYKGLGEMQTLANGVGDLKKVLSNVKTRGILGEVQLGAILEQMMSPEQYDENVVTKPGSGFPVEFAVKMPTDEGSFTYLPIDAKFPMDAYSALLEAYDKADQSAVDNAAAVLSARLRHFAKDIHDKYIEPPYTTEFGIMFLPVEGLYAEAVRMGLIEVLQREYKVSMAGPTTMSALLNSLQMGFRSLAIQKRSSEVWNLLGSVRTEFDKFASVLASTQERISQANAELDKLVGVRTRQIQRKLKDVTALPGFEEADDETRYIDDGQ